MLIKNLASRGRKIVLSTGWASLAEIERALNDIVSTGNQDIVLMHCVSAYPCPLEQTNLYFINILSKTFGFPVGFSDHTEGSLAGAIAICFGASYLEKHFTLDRTQEGFDHSYAMEPDSFRHYVRDMRSCVLACSQSLTKLQDAEAALKPLARRGLYAAHDISVGRSIELEDVLIVRPESDLMPNDIFHILGMRAKVPFRRYQPFFWKGLE